MSYLNTTAPNGTPVSQPQPSPTAMANPSLPEVKFMLFRNKPTGQMITNDDGVQIPEWDRDEDGRFIQDPVAPAEAQKGDTVIIKGWYHLAMQNPAEAMAKIDKANSDLLPQGLRVAPSKGSPQDFSLSNALGRPVRCKISSNGSYIGWVAEDTGSPSNPHAVTL